MPELTTITLVLDPTQGTLADFNKLLDALDARVDKNEADNAALAAKVTDLETENLGLCERAAALEADVTALKGELATVKANLLKAADALDD